MAPPLAVPFEQIVDYSGIFQQNFAMTGQHARGVKLDQSPKAFHMKLQAVVIGSLAEHVRLKHCRDVGA